MQWHPGVLYSSGHNSQVVMVDLQGSRLATMSVPDMMELTTKIMRQGFNCSRIDLAVDHVGMGLDLYKRALNSCQNGQLCKLRSYSPDPEYKVDGTPIRLLLKLGKRESSVCVRIYDKGLEAKTLSLGQWERFEVEFKDDRAAEVCMDLVQSGGQLNESIWQYIIGAIDFRVINGRTELDRRPRVEWWERYIGQVIPRITRPIKRESSLATWIGWFRTSVGPRLLQLACILELTPFELIEHLIENLEPASSIVPAVVEAKMLTDDSADS